MPDPQEFIMLLDISLSLFALLCLCESGHYTLEIKTGDGSLGADGSLENTVFPEGAGLESLSLIIERANQSFVRMKSISTEADKAASEMEELISILQKFRVKDGTTGVVTSNELGTTQPPLDVTGGSSEPAATETATDESNEEAEDGNDGKYDFASTQPPLEEDVSSSGQIPEPTTDKSIEKAEDGNGGESEIASTQPPLEEDVSSSGQIPEPSTDESNEELAEDGTGAQGSTEPLTVFPEVDEEELPSNCHYNFTSQQIPGNPKSTCAAWLLNNYHKHNEGWRSCQDTGYHRYDENGLFGKSKLPF